VSKVVLCSVLFVVLLSLGATAVFAAETSVTPAKGTYAKGQTFTATVRVDPQGKSVNAVEATLTFDTSKFSVVSVSKTGSVFSLWTTEPTFSNTQGTIQFGGGSPTPFSAPATLAVITFRATAEGDGEVAFKTASVLAADGLGTDVYSGGVKATYTVSAGKATPDTPPTDTKPTDAPAQDLNTGDAPKDKPTDAAIAFGDPPRAPEVGSKQFLDPELWYATTTGIFTWDLPFDVNALYLEIATSSNNIPTKKVAPPVGTITLTPFDLHDGVQYLSMRYGNQVGLGAILNRKIMVDATPPEPFTINVRAGNSTSSFPTLHFEAHDPTSGIHHYELTIANREPVTVTPDEAKLGYLITALEDGTYTVHVKAFDKAGNVTESNTPLLITAGWTKPAEKKNDTSFWSLFSLANLFFVSLLTFIGVLIGYIIYLRKLFSRKETRLRKETKEIQDQMEKIFSALRDEIYDQINAITKKPRLSRQEKEAVENLGSALEVSETLIEKEIVDVQKILR
jgi:uncharacterized protein (UPF0335 family)